MNEDLAWNVFIKTGRITDYLVYSQIKNQNKINSQEEEAQNANKYRRSCSKGNEYF